MGDDIELLTVGQMARLLEIDAEQILRWRIRGRGPDPVDDSPIPRWRPSEVSRWLSDRLAEELDSSAEVRHTIGPVRQAG